MKKLLLLTILLCNPLLYQVQKERPIPGDEQTAEYFPILKGKWTVIFSNHTGMVRDRHLLDILLGDEFNVIVIFSPEHGFRGNADAGEYISNSVGKKTGVFIFSLRDGKDKKPSEVSARKFDVPVIDIQNVGLRSYTYYITMCRSTDAHAECNHEVLLLDRPNPNGHYVDGPILDMKYKSGVSWLPIPIVHGMALDELALMASGERWLLASRVCNLIVASCKNYTHQTRYTLPVPPSPNLPSMKSVYSYPAARYFEATLVSLGRNTSFPFQIYDHPSMTGYTYSFTPESVPGAKNPSQLSRLRHDVNLSNMSDEEIWKRGVGLSYIIDTYKSLNVGGHFFRPFFKPLVGTDYVRKVIKDGKGAEEIKSCWKGGMEGFKEQRKSYLLYKG